MPAKTNDHPNFYCNRGKFFSDRNSITQLLHPILLINQHKWNGLTRLIMATYIMIQATSTVSVIPMHNCQTQSFSSTGKNTICHLPSILSNKNTGPHHLMQPMSHANNFCIDEHELPNMVHLFHTTILKIPYLISGCQHDSMPLNEIKSWLASCVPIQPLVAILTFYMSFQQNNYSPIQWPMFLT